MNKHSVRSMPQLPFGRRLSFSLLSLTLCLFTAPLLSVSHILLPAIAQSNQKGEAEKPKQNLQPVNPLLQQGTRHYETAEYEKALKLLHQALEQFKQRNDRSSEIQVLIVLSEVHTELDKNDKAVQLGQEAVRLAQAGKFRLLEGRALTAVGRALFQKQSDQNVQQIFETSLAIARETQDRQGEGWALLGLSGVHLQVLKQPKTAVELGQQALKIAKDLGDRRMEGRAFWRIGNALSDERTSKERVAAYQQGLIASRAADDRRNTALTLLNIGQSWNSVQEIIQLLPYLQEAAELAEVLPSINLRYFTYYALGNAYSIVPGQADKAIEPLQKALVIAQAQKNLENQYVVFTSLSIAYNNMSDSTNATKAATQLLKVAQELRSPAKQADAYKVLGLVAWSAKYHQVAVSHYQQAITLYRQLKDYTREAETLELLLAPLDGLKEYEQKLMVIRQILQLSQIHPDLAERANKVLKFHASGTFLLYGDKYAKEKNYTKAIAIFESFLALGKEYNRKDLQAQALDELGSVYWRQQDYSRAVMLFEQGLIFAQESNQVSSQGSINLRLGMTYISQRSYAKAAAAMQQAYAFSQQLIEDPFVNNPEQKGSQPVAESTRNHGYVMQHIALRNLAWSYQRLRNFPKAVEFAQLAIQDARTRNKTENFHGASYHLVEIHTDAKQYPEAISAAQSFLRQAEQRNDRKSVATAYAWIAWVYQSAKDYPRAIQAAEQGIAIAQKMGDESLRGWILNRLGEIYIDKGDYATAIAQAQTVLSLFPKLNAPNVEIYARANLGRVYFAQQEYAKATEQLQRGILVAQKVDNTDELARLWLVQGQVYGATQEYAKMLDALERSQENARKLENAVRQSFILLTRAQACAGLGSTSCANEAIQQADTLREGVSSLGNVTEIETQALLLSARVAFNQGDYQRSLALAQKSLPLFQATKNPGWEAYAYYLIAINYAELNDDKQAIAGANRSLDIAQTNQNNFAQANAFYALAEIYRKFGQSTRAMNYYQSSISLVPDQNTNSYAGLARLYREQQPPLAITFYKQAVNQVESIRQKNRDLPRDLQESFLQSVQGLGSTKVVDIYRELAELLIAQERIIEAQQVLDLLKVQELKDYLQNTRGVEEKLIVLRPEQEILKRYEALQQGAVAIGKELAELEKLARSGTPLTSAQEQRKNQLVKLRKELNQQFNEFTRSTEVQNFVKQLTPTEIETRLPFDELRGAGKKMAQLNAVLLYPMVLDDRLELIVTAPNAQPLRRTVKGVGRQQLNAAMIEFRQALENPNSDPKPIAQKLYRWLIEPIEADLQKANPTTIIYAPDGQLRYIPLSALYDGKQWLIQRYRINNITAKAIDDLTSKPQRQPRILAGAFGSSGSQVTVAGRNFNFGGLGFTTKEVQKLATLLPSTRALFDQAFGLQAITNQMNDYTIVHLATHAKLVPEAADQSFILFGDRTVATLKEIEDWTLDNVDLIVLSACETGLGGKFGANGEEVLGLGYQFTKQDKARAAIASLWQVDDGGTQALMNEFYAALRTEIPKAQALQAAQNALITHSSAITGSKRSDVEVINTRTGQPFQGNQLSHPYYWAPFILIGNGL